MGGSVSRGWYVQGVPIFQGGGSGVAIEGVQEWCGQGISHFSQVGLLFFRKWETSSPQ